MWCARVCLVPPGVLRILELPRNLRRPVHNEKKLMGAWLERQQSRLEDVGGRQPGRAAARKEAEVGATSSLLCGGAVVAGIP